MALGIDASYRDALGPFEVKVGDSNSSPASPARWSPETKPPDLMAFPFASLHRSILSAHRPHSFFLPSANLIFMRGVKHSVCVKHS